MQRGAELKITLQINNQRTLTSVGVFFSNKSKIPLEKFASVNSISYLSIVMRG
jgi:hypothetical protein